MIRRLWHKFWLSYHEAMLMNYYDGDEIKDIPFYFYTRFDDEREYHRKWKEHHKTKLSKLRGAA